jgi:ferric iron reductase protein FhuF
MVSDTSKDITTLLWFRLSETLNTEPLTIEVDSLLSGNLEDYISKVMVGIGAPNDKVTASMIMKRYAFFAAMALFTMSHSDRRINIRTNNVTLVSHYEDGLWLPKLYLKDLSFEFVSGDRQLWREQYVKGIFANHIYLLMDQLSKITKISKLILWENIAVYLFWLYESVLNESSEERKEIIEEDFRYLFYDAPGSVFGEYNHNPLTKYNSENIFNPDTEKYIRYRKTCCFSYKLEGNHKRCKTCPCFQMDSEGGCLSEQSFCSTIRSVDE